MCCKQAGRIPIAWGRCDSRTVPRSKVQSVRSRRDHIPRKSSRQTAVGDVGMLRKRPAASLNILRNIVGAPTFASSQKSAACNDASESKSKLWNKLAFKPRSEVPRGYCADFAYQRSQRLRVWGIEMIHKKNIARARSLSFLTQSKICVLAAVVSRMM